MISLTSSTYYNAAELEKLGIDPHRLEQARAAGMIPAVQPGKEFLYEGHQVTQWLREGARTEASYRSGVHRVGSALVIEGRLPTHIGTSPGSVEPGNAASASASSANVNPNPSGVATAAPQPKRRNTVTAQQTMNTDPVAEFDRRVCTTMAQGLDRRAAITAVVTRDPELHERFLEESNRRARRRQNRRAVRTW